jgi:hypothetical protein
MGRRIAAVDHAWCGACFLTREERVVVKPGAHRAPSLIQLVRCLIHAWCGPWNFTLNEPHKAGSAAAISLPIGYRWTNHAYPDIKSAHAHPWIASHIDSILHGWRVCEVGLNYVPYGNLAPLGISNFRNCTFRNFVALGILNFRNFAPLGILHR